jgi:hypothetical protein
MEEIRSIHHDVGRGGRSVGFGHSPPSLLVFLPILKFKNVHSIGNFERMEVSFWMDWKVKPLEFFK